MDDEEFEEFLESAFTPPREKKKKDRHESESSSEEDINHKTLKRKKGKRGEKSSDDEQDLVVEGPEPPPKPDSSSSGSDSEDSARKRRTGSRRRRSRSRSPVASRKRRSRSRSRSRSRERKRRRSKERERDRERRRRERERRERLEKERRQREKEREERRRRLEKERRQREKEREERRKEERRRREKEERRRREKEEKERKRRQAEKKKREKEEEERKRKEEEEKKRKREEEGPSLTDIMLENPGMSMQDALQKLAEVNQARLMKTANPVSAPGQPPLVSPIQNPALTKPYRDLYIGNLPQGTTGPQLQEALGALMNQMGLVTSPGNPILSTWLSQDTHYAFCEFRSVEEANNAITLNGIMLGNSTLKVGRPKSYQGPPVPDPKNPTLGLSQAQTLAAATNPALLNLGNVPPGVMAGAATNLLGAVAAAGIGVQPAAAPVVPGLLGSIPGLLPNPGALPNVAPSLPVAKPPSSKVLMITNLPQACDATQVKELVKPFGTVTRFNLLMDSEGNSKGTAVFEYEDIGACEMATKGLNDLPIGDKKLMVQNVPEAMAETLLKPVEIKLPTSEEAGEPTRVVCLVNMVSPDELADDQEFEDIKEDVADECNKFGTVQSIEIPRPAAGEVVAGLGKIFVEFADTLGSSKARKSLAGRTFANKKVEATFFPENLFQEKIFENSNDGETSAKEVPQENVD